MREAKNRHVTAALMALSVQYYRPDFTEGQARVLIKTMLEDMDEFTFPQINEAIKAYRRDGKNKFFPTSGQLYEAAKIARREEREAEEAAIKGKIRPEFGDSRPSRWWCKPKALWARHWRESEIPEEWRGAYEAKKSSSAEGAATQ